MRRLMLLGLDGATWDVLEPLAEEGRISTIKKLIDSGVHGKLESTFPPKTGPAWISMATGKNPGKTGVYDFLKRREDDFSYRVINSRDFRDNSPYWDILNHHGFKTYMLNHPILYPFYDIDGVLVGGMGLPEDADLSYPKELEKKINKVSDGYWTRVDWHSKEYENDKEKFLKDIKKLIDKQFKVVEFFLDEDWDFFLHVNSGTDYLQHVMMDDWVNEDSEFHDDFIEVWELVDKKLEKIIKKLTDVNILIVSDHGFGPLKKKLNLAKVLYDEGLIEKMSFSGTRKGLKVRLNTLYQKTPLSRYINLEESLLYRLINKLNIRERVSPEIDLKNSKAIPTVTEGGTAGIHINKEHGDLEKIKSEVRDCIEKINEDLNIRIKIYEPEELYQGDKLDAAPDLFLKSEDPSISFNDTVLEGVTLSDDLPRNASGNHRMDGIFIAHGPDIKRSADLQYFKIYDIAPTILHHYDIPVPKDIDGKVLKEIFKEESEIYKREITYSDEREKNKIQDAIKGLKI